MKVPGYNGRRQKLYRHGRSKISFHRKEKERIWSLPEELLLHLLKRLHITDLLSMRSTHPNFRHLIDNHPTVWTMACFKDAWPTLPNMKHFNKAAEHGNIEALIKLGIAYLYNEGLPSDFQGRKVTTNGEHAAQMFCKVETLLPNVTPFTWLFIRPPWATSGACCKECVFRNMKSYTAKYNVPNVTVCIAKTLQLLEEESLQQEAVVHLQQATAHGSPHASFLLWQHKYDTQIHDAALELEAIRELRNQVNLRDPDAILRLCRFYVQKKYGGLSEYQAASYARNFIQSSEPTHIEDIYKESELTHSMRYILVDWLVEVAGMKDFGSSTLHAAISVVDRFLRFHQTSRAKFQLLGVAAMVLCSRFLGKDIITIREAAWLTDNTYKYEDVVRMMGEIISTLRGSIRVWCSLDYVQLIGLLANNEPQTQCMAEYVCELALLQSDLGPYPQAEIAASAVLLARLALKKEFPWPQQMIQFTGYSVPGLANCTMQILEKCFLEGAMVDHRAMILQAVKQRYSDADFFEVSTLKVPTSDDLRALLGMHQPVSLIVDLKLDLDTMPKLIMSPSRNKNGHANRPCLMSLEREQAATPTLESMEKSLEALMNESHLSGYEGDLEDELDSFVEEESEVESLLCQEDESSSLISSPGLPCHSDSSGWFGSDTSFSAFSPKPSSSTRYAPITASTPSIRINLPSFGYINSSPITSCYKPARPPSLASPRTRASAAQSSTSDMSCFVNGAAPNLSVSKLRASTVFSGGDLATDHSAVKGSSRPTQLSLRLSKDSFRVAEMAVDSGIDITGLYDQSTSGSILDTPKRVPCRPPLSTISNKNHAGSSSRKMESKEVLAVKQRKRRNSSQLSNENKTHVISL